MWLYILLLSLYIVLAHITLPSYQTSNQTRPQQPPAPLNHLPFRSHPLLSPSNRPPNHLTRPPLPSPSPRAIQLFLCCRQIRLPMVLTTTSTRKSASVSLNRNRDLEAGRAAGLRVARGGRRLFHAHGGRRRGLGTERAG